MERFNWEEIVNYLGDYLVVDNSVNNQRSFIWITKNLRNLP